MKFFFADSQDHVDPHFDFVRDAYHPARYVQRDDVYPHEYFEEPPYDGMLVSRAIVGDDGFKGKYTTAQAIRFRRDGADRFLRYEGALMGDCGAFSYINLPNPPYQVDEIVDYYADCHFTLAVSIDHVILGYDESADSPSLFNAMLPPEWVRRFDLTLELAAKFHKRCREVAAPFRPVGVAQGWSPNSYAEAARRLIDMGYDYVALGGMVPLKKEQIHQIVDRVRQVSPSVDLHLFGFTKADSVQEFTKYGIASLDSTSPMLRAFKDGKSNYFNGDRWYTAIRVPQADENRKFKQAILAGHKDQRRLRTLEQEALNGLRSYDRRESSLDKTLSAVEAYGGEFSEHPPMAAYREVLEDRPWSSCPCKVCRDVGIEVILFRGSNRNRRRGFHNLWAFHRKLQGVRMATV